MAEPPPVPGVVAGLGTPPTAERMAAHRQAAERASATSSGRAAPAPGTAAAPTSASSSLPSFGSTSSAAAAGDSLSEMVPSSSYSPSSYATVGTPSPHAGMLDYVDRATISHLAQQRLVLDNALASYKPTTKAEKIIYKKTISEMNRKFKEMAKMLEQQAGTYKEEEEVRPTLEIKGRVPVATIAKVMRAALPDVLDHLEAVGEDLEQLAATARELGEDAATVDPDVAEFVVTELGGVAVRSDFQDRRPAERPSASAAEELGLPPRVPVVTVMGHVDHGKTTLLDFLRSASVAEGEAGGITQAVSAFCVQLDDPFAVDSKAKAKKGGRKAKGKKGGAGSAVDAAKSNAEGCLTFIDTPGHQLFSGMRQRGTAVTDAVVLVVAAEDGVMPQTVECVELLARVPEVPVVVALTKIDRLSEGERAEARERVAEQLANAGLITEPAGGTVPMVGLSGVTGEGVEELKEHLLLQCEVLELRADPGALGEAAVLDSKLVRGMGYVADCVVQWGTLKVGQPFVVGSVAGRIKGLIDDAGARHKEMPPGLPVRVVGMTEPPPAGELLMAVETDERAADVSVRRRRSQELSTNLSRARERAEAHEEFAARRREERRQKAQVDLLHRRAAQRRRMLVAKEEIPDDMLEQPWERRLQAQLVEEAEALARGQIVKRQSVMVERGQQREEQSDPLGRPTLPVVLRADMKGSLEALEAALMAFPQDDVAIRVVRQDVGSPSPADLDFARDTGALMLAFNVGVPNEVQRKADMEDINVVRGNVIYTVLQAVADAIGPLLPAQDMEVVRGVAEVLGTFAITTRRAKAQTAAGCRVIEGKIESNAPIRVMRQGELVFEAPSITALKRFRDDVVSVEKGAECGISLRGFADFELGDRLHSYGMDKVPAKLDISYLGAGANAPGHSERA
ncbi:hypothetical protein FNF27_07582 [Cafeteria roenbergensis]|uniref:Tr-type G domain-containing protein n=4 Tax=Cafeteria roenbergensis TaxID=33653 RepID=A0A5A8CL09_CAFRO|nr:hypothetical protein FNF29_03392 [Cafeteria roenbergensis]KAA0165895.1 hypothetical protein FNF27_07582 [Cafeteria roenbergensis]|eukprot:KAA0153204.1 hypothetical protein FNF29_03392 [Cafeteria roenbergensis]